MGLLPLEAEPAARSRGNGVTPGGIAGLPMGAPLPHRVRQRHGPQVVERRGVLASVQDAPAPLRGDDIAPGLENAAEFEIRGTGTRLAVAAGEALGTRYACST